MDVLIAKRELMIKMRFEKFTSKGYAWLATKNGWKDLSTSLTWKYEDEEGKYTFDDAVAKFGDSLPSKEEWEIAESHGVREVLDLEGKWLWSSSVISNSRDVSWNFAGTAGYVGTNARSSLNWARCVGR